MEKLHFAKRQTNNLIGTEILFLNKAKWNLNLTDFVFDVNEVEEKYYLSDKVRDYVLSSGTKTFKTSTKTDLEVARPLLQINAQNAQSRS
jgi:hypothetical protein